MYFAIPLLPVIAHWQTEILFGGNFLPDRPTSRYLSSADQLLCHFNFNSEFRFLIVRILRKLETQTDGNPTLCLQC